MSKLKKKVSYYNSGEIKSEVYYLGDKLHREDGPAVIYYYKSGEIKRERYYLGNGRHREDGPAVVDYCKNGKVAWKLYWIKGERATKEQIEEIKFNKQFEADLKGALSE